MTPKSVPGRRKVKSGSDTATDAHERPKDYLNEAEIAGLLQAAKRGHDLRLIQDYLGHRDPRHTVHYTRVVGSRFEGIWS
jgi:hypothetical protein